VRATIAFFLLFLGLLAGCQRYMDEASAVSLEERNPRGIVFTNRECAECATCKKVAEEGYRSYHLSAQNVPEGEVFHLMKGVLGNGSYIASYALRDGAFVDDSARTLESQRFIMGSFCPGEAVDFYLVSANGESCVKTSVIPHPIETAGTHGETLRVLVQDPGGRLFLAEGKGFQPDEKLTLSTYSNQESIIETFRADGEGSFRMLLFPAATGGEGGIVALRLVRSEGMLQMEFPWGKPVFGRKDAAR
jgi:hypothetical protein